MVGLVGTMILVDSSAQRATSLDTTVCAFRNIVVMELKAISSLEHAGTTVFQVRIQSRTGMLSPSIKTRMNLSQSC